MIGRYRVVEHVGAEGTMADVYRAESDSGLTVAVKLLGPPNAQTQREAQVGARLNYPGIVQTYEVLEWEGRLCLIQEWVDGESLATILDSGRRLSVAEAVRLGVEVGEALEYAHGKGVLHRDIKPSNVLRTSYGQYMLLDFGAVGLLESDGRTRAGEIAGTPLYMAPEQGIGAPQTPATDVFGLGLLLARATYGTTPGESALDYGSLILGRSTEQIVVPESLLQKIIQRCLVIDPAKRWQSAQAVVRALRRQFTVLPPPEIVPAAGDVILRSPRRAAARELLRRLPSLGGRLAPSPITPALAMVIVVAAVAGLVAWLLAPDPADVGFWLRVGVGIVIVGGAFVGARYVRRLASRAPETERQAASIVLGAGGREALTRSMVLEVDQVVAKLKGLDAKFLGLTMVMLIKEAEQAKESADRVAALVQMVTLMEKLMKQLSPWHVRHKEAIATVIAVVGSLVGVASVVSGFLR